MEKSPAFQFYPKDFLSDDAAAVMTTEQIGAYWLLLCHAWLRPEGLPGDLSVLAKLARAHPLRFSSKIWPALRPCFRTTDAGGWANPRLERERQKQLNFKAERREAGKVGAEKRWHSHESEMAQPSLSHDSADGSATREPMAKHGSSSSSSSLKESATHRPMANDGSAIAVAGFLEGYRERYERITGAKLPLTWSAKDHAIAARMLKTWPIARLLDMAEIFLHRNDRQVEGRPKTLPFFEPIAPWCDQQLAGAGR